MHFTKSLILAYSKFYDAQNKAENSIEQDILNAVKIVNSTDDLFKLLLDKDNGILKWKGALRIRRFFEGEEYWTTNRKMDLLQEIKESCSDPIKNKDVVTKIGNGKYKGISYPIASTIVFFFSQGNCPIKDWRAMETLKNFGHDIKDDWDEYFNKCLELKNDNDVSFRDFDKALWIYPDIKKNLQTCKKLMRLGITENDLSTSISIKL
jgi:hypothetical protein